MTPLFSTLLGACIGSFLNVCLSRWKSGSSILFPPSSCPHCHKSILWYDNIPLLSFVLLRAQCRFCHKPISWQYPLVEGGTGLLFGLSSIYFGRDLFLTVESFFFVGLLVLLAVSDLKWKLLPHPFTNLFILVGLLLPKGPSFFSLADLYNRISGFIFLGFFLYGIILFYPKGFGGGDVKMGAALAIWLGLYKSVYALALASTTAMLVYAPLLLMKKITKKSPIPFGPFIAFGSIILWFWPGLMKQVGINL